VLLVKCTNYFDVTDTAGALTHLSTQQHIPTLIANQLINIHVICCPAIISATCFAAVHLLHTVDTKYKHNFPIHPRYIASLISGKCVCVHMWRQKTTFQTFTYTFLCHSNGSLLSTETVLLELHMLVGEGLFNLR